MTQFMLLLRGVETSSADFSPEEMQQSLEKYRQWMESLAEQSKLVGGTKLIGRGGRVLSVKKGQLLVDGPFTETKETIGGQFTVEATSYKEAIALAQDCPLLDDGGTIEVREVDPDAPLCHEIIADYGATARA